MFYDFVLTQGHDRGSIMPIRKYKSSKLTDTVIGNVNTILYQALDATGVMDDHEDTAYLEFNTSWVDEQRQYDETFDMLLADNWFDETTGELKSHGARVIAKQILTDLASSEEWASRYDGAKDAFDNLDFEQFAYIDNRVNNDNLKIPIGEKVYLRGYGDTVYTYQGRPSNDQIKWGNKHYTNRSDAWSIDENVMKVEDFDLKKYASRIEVFPLPVLANLKRSIGDGRYFAREKVGNKVIRETYGNTQKEVKTNLALRMAFAEIPKDATV